MSTTEKLIEYVTESGIHRDGQNVVYIAEHEGRRWLTNSYWMVPTTDAIADVLAAFNLTDEPGRLSVAFGRLRRVNGEPPEPASVAKIFSGLAAATSMERLVVRGFEVQTDQEKPLVPFQRAQRTTWVAKRFVSFVHLVCGSTDLDWRGTEPLDPIGVHRSGLVAVVMPVRAG